MAPNLECFLCSETVKKKQKNTTYLTIFRGPQKMRKSDVLLQQQEEEEEEEEKLKQAQAQEQEQQREQEQVYEQEQERT